MTTPTSIETRLRELLTRSVIEVKHLRGEVARLRQTDDREPIAIVGLGLRVPGGVEDLDGLWQLLADGRDTVGPVPASRWDVERCFDPNPATPGTTYVREASFVDGVEGFDPGFFNISPREAKRMDPQHRLLLETSWQALEHAGVVPSSLAGTRTGVYVGVGPSEYASAQPSETADAFAVMGTHTSFAAGRVAFHLGLRGPAVAVDTACSSSLVALHLACQALRTGECELALAAGVQVMAGPDGFIHLSRTRAVAPDGRCKSFSAHADGYGRGEGVVVVALERLSQARARGRRILAVVRGSAVNHDGASNGITAPSGAAQREVLRAALDDAGLRPGQIDAIECHGTGTELGDPIEIAALAAVYGEGRPAEQPLLVGTIKSNIGHLESAAGLAGLAKVVAALARQTLPASLHCSPPNPHVDWDATPIAVVDAPRPWPRRADRPRRAGVSGFGLSGTNAHVIVEEPPAELKEPKDQADSTIDPIPVLLAARSAAALAGQAARLRAHLDARPELLEHPRSLAHALATTREPLEHRACLLAQLDDPRALLDDLDELAAHGHAHAGARIVSATVPRRAARLALAFTGQGAQRPGMGGELCERFPDYRAAFEAVCAGFDGRLDRPLREVVLARPDTPAAARLDLTGYTQPALFAVEVALARLLERFGVRPDVLIGHSIGELAAAHVAGVLSLDHACELVAARARLMQALPEGGAMASIQATAAELEPVLADHPGVEIAGLNSPSATVVSGDTEPVERVAELFAARGRKVRRLKVSHAFHSHRMQPMLDAFAEVAGKLEYRPPTIPIVSNVTGELGDPQLWASPDYWVRQVRAPVRFAEGVAALAEFGTTLVLELGPHGVLTPMAAACLTDRADPPALVSALRKDRPEADALVSALGALHCHGVAVDWRPALGRRPAGFVELPTYAFCRRPYWLRAPARPARGSSPKHASTGRYPLAGRRLDLAAGTVLHTVDVGPAIQSYLASHVVYDHVIVPGAFYLAVLLAIAASHWPERALELREVQFIRALSFRSRSEQTELHVELARLESGEPGFCAALYTVAEGRRIEHARGTIAPAPADAERLAEPVPRPSDPAIEDFCELDALLRHYHIEWGPKWWWFRDVSTLGPRVALARLAPPDADVPDDDAPLPAGLIDNSFTLQAWTHADTRSSDDSPQLPFYVDRLVWYGATGRRPAHARLTHLETLSNSARADLAWWDADGRPLAHATGYVSRRAPRDRFLAPRFVPNLYALEWRGVAPERARSEVARVAVIGADAAELTGERETARSFADLGALVAELDRGEPAPERIRVAWRATGDDAHIDPASICAGVLAQIQAWLAEPRLDASRLELVTRRAVAAQPGEDVRDRNRAAAWGLVRTVALEHPKRSIAIVDLDDDPASARALGPSLALVESQLAIRSGRCLAPRLTRASAGEVSRPPSLSAGTVLITGGTGELGARLARHFVDRHGVRRLLLVSRRGPAAPGAGDLIAALEQAGAEVSVRAVDVGVRAELRDAIASIPAAHPLCAVVHAAGVLADGLASTLGPEQITRVFAAKVDAARHLHALTRRRPLAAFVLFSSISGTLGSPGQANYAAANAWLDALAHARRARGLVATSIAWGPWAGGGMASRLDPGDRARLRRSGIASLDPDEALAILDVALARPDPLAIGVGFELDVLARAASDLPAMFRAIVHPPRRPPSSPPPSPIATREAPAGPGTGRGASSLADLIAREVAAVLDLDPTELDADRPLTELGLDSLTAIELENRIRRLTGVKLASTALLDDTSCACLTALVHDELGLSPTDEDPTPTPTPTPTGSGTGSGPGPEPEPDSGGAAVRSYLALQTHAGAPAREDAGRREQYGVLQLMRDIVESDSSASLEPLLECLVGRRRVLDADHRAPAPEVARLSRLDAPASIYCIPAFGLPSSALQFIRIADACRDRAAIWSATNPGMSPGEALPASLDAAVDYHVEAWREVAARTREAPAILGYSSGGWLAVLVAARLEAEAAPAPGLVFLDSPHPFEMQAKRIKDMFISNAVEHHFATLGDDARFIHELTGMLWLMQLAHAQWPELSLVDTPTLHIASSVGFDFPRWELEVVTNPKKFWAPRIDDLTVVATEIGHYELLTTGAKTCASHVAAWLAPHPSSSTSTSRLSH